MVWDGLGISRRDSGPRDLLFRVLRLLRFRVCGLVVSALRFRGMGPRHLGFGDMLFLCGLGTDMRLADMWVGRMFSADMHCG